MKQSEQIFLSKAPFSRGNHLSPGHQTQEHAQNQNAAVCEHLGRKREIGYQIAASERVP